MTVTYTDINWTAKADEGKALCPANENGPTTITEVTAPLSVPVTAWKDCEYGEPADGAN